MSQARSSTVGLDPTSRQTIARLLFQLVCYAFLAAAPVLTGFVPAADGVTAFGSYCSFSALLHVVRATRRGERVCGPSLNEFDEGIAAAGIGLLAFFVARMLTSQTPSL